MKTIAAIHPEQITIRVAYPADGPALLKLAQLDSSALPVEPLLVAEAAGRPRAALSLADGRSIADPFFPTDILLALLHVHAAQLGARRWGGARRRRSTLSAARAVWRSLGPRDGRLPVAPGALAGPAAVREATIASAPGAYLRAS